MAQNESLTATLEQRDAAFAKQSETLRRYEARLADVDTLVSDKEALEEQVGLSLAPSAKVAHSAVSTVEMIDVHDCKGAFLKSCPLIYVNGYAPVVLF